ncbi:hypothetical protein JXQ70_10070 [bacterium]|nr:hypothetical protein [bacterium]
MPVGLHGSMTTIQSDVPHSFMRGGARKAMVLAGLYLLVTYLISPVSGSTLSLSASEETSSDTRTTTIYLGEEIGSTSRTLKVVRHDGLERPDRGSAHAGPVQPLRSMLSPDFDWFSWAESQSQAPAFVSLESMARLDQVVPALSPSVRSDLSGTAYISSHYAGFVTNYPHDDGVSYDYYNLSDEKFPIWGMAAGGPSPGVQSSVWIGGDFDSKYTTEPCGTPNDCYVPPPVDNMYRGWRTQGYGSAPCNCPAAFQPVFYSANRGIMMFDLSLVPDGAQVTGVQFEAVLSKQFGSGEILNFSEIEADRSRGYENVAGYGFKWSYDDASDGQLYQLGWSVGAYAVGNTANTTLNALAVADVQAALEHNWFGLGLVSGAGETATTSYYFGAFQGSGGVVPPQLIIDYDYIVPDQVMLQDEPGYATTADGESGCPILTWDIPNEETGNPLHFILEVSDTVPVYHDETFISNDFIDLSQTSYSGMVITSRHDSYDAYGSYLGTDYPHVQLDPLELIYGGSVYPYARNYNVGWRFGRPFVSHLATDTWTGEGYSVDGLGDGLMGWTYMEWASYYSIEYPNTACATQLGFPANVIGVGGFIPSGITESFWIAFDYFSDGSSDWFPEILVSNAADSFYVEFSPAIEDVAGVALFFTASSDNFAYLADLQVYDSEIYDTSESQTVTSEAVAASANPAHSFDRVVLTVFDEQPAGTTIEYELSNDDGIVWYQVTPNTEFIFPDTGNQLRWRAHLSTSSPSLTPKIYQVILDNLVLGLNSEYDYAEFEENAIFAGEYQTMSAAGVPEYAGTQYQARHVPTSLSEGTYYWKVKAVAPAGSGGFGQVSPVWSFEVVDDTVPPPALGATLMADKISTTVVGLDWSAYVPEPDSQYRVYRSENPAAVNVLIATVGSQAYTDGDATADFLCYVVNALDQCLNESQDE